MINRPIRIAISGAAGTGKSTLAEAIAKQLRIGFIPEGVREWFTKNDKNFKTMTPEDFMMMQHDLLGEKINLEACLVNFIVDCSTAEGAAYVLRWSSRTISEYEVKVYVNKCREHCSTYDLICFLPRSIPLVDDGVRSSNDNYNYSMNCMIKGVLTDWGIPYYTVRSTTLEDRIYECVLAYRIMDKKIKEGLA